ncbi:MAG TPA: tRNA modification GTPase [Gemmataceae bacterium]|nr:tRNA modification GTPase [Gemmataceae bacterium]
MLPHLEDTIVALSSAPGPGARAIVRLSGSQALRIARTVFHAAEVPDAIARRLYEGNLLLAGLSAPVPAAIGVFPAPRTYTGQEVVEIHTVSSMPIVEALTSALLNAGARAAQPGEFTLRAFLAGKLDLTKAEAVLGVIEAGDREQLGQALSQLAGGVTRPLQGLRDDLLSLLADVEAGLDFVDEDISFVRRDDLLIRLAKGLAQVTLARKQLDERATSDRPFRIVLIGRPNVGKSSLFNAVAGTGADALVSPHSGTTRDYLVKRIDLDGIAAELVDTAGRMLARDLIEEQAQSLGRDQSEQSDLIVLCVESGEVPDANQNAFLNSTGRTPVVAVATKCDLAAPATEWLATSTRTGEGLDALRREFVARARAHARPSLAPSLSRCRHHVDACLDHLRKAHSAVLFDDPPEVLALELRAALEQLGAIVGAVYTDDLLDRIFSRFCIGK